ncbi:hypothetical protein ACFO3O_15355 [Dokdonia ponticola]|uniref:Bacteriocin n=1 Tax=Dokdonia ponticola TaxID=2041041 RepID=A0ABV9I0K1_9FLAO
MKKKKIKLQFDKKVIAHLTKIQGGQEIESGTLSNAPDAQSVCLCGPTTAPNNETSNCGNSSLVCGLISNEPGFCTQSVERC